MKIRALNTNPKKANAMLEYGILLLIVIGAMAGIHYYLKRSIQARVKRESDLHLGHGQGLEWASSITFASSSSTINRDEKIGGQVFSHSASGVSQTTLQVPVPSIRGWSLMEHKGSALHVQDAASSPPVPNYPALKYEKYPDPGPPRWD